MSINQELSNIISNLDDNSLLNNSLQIKELLYSGAVLDDALSETLFVSSVELLEKIKTNHVFMFIKVAHSLPSHYNLQEKEKVP